MDTGPRGEYEVRALDAVMADPLCRAILDRMPERGLSEWWLTAGAVFQNICNAVLGLPAGHGIKDYDVFCFDSGNLTWSAEDEVIQTAKTLFADIEATIELRNEARVHLWYEDKFGVAAPPFTSATGAIDAFASTTCSVGIIATERITKIYAPHGLHDVFHLVMRPTPRLAPRSIYEAKVARYRERWPCLTFGPWAGRLESAGDTSIGSTLMPRTVKR